MLRADFDTGNFDRWLSAMGGADRKVWTAPLTTASLAAYQNHTYTLQALIARMSMEALPPEAAAIREKILEPTYQRAARRQRV